MSYIPKQLVLLNKQTASNSAALIFTTGITATYTSYLLSIRNYVPANDDEFCLLFFSVDGGATYVNSKGYYGSNWANDNTTGNFDASASNWVETAVKIGNAAPGLNQTIWFYNLGSASLQTNIYQQGTAFSTGGIKAINYFGGGAHTSTSINAFKITPSAGNITSGSAYLYGVIEP